MFASFQVGRHPFDLIGVDVRRRVLDRRREVDDDWPAWTRVPSANGRVARLECHRQLGHAERFGRIFEHPLGFGQRIGELFDEPDLFRDELHHFIVLMPNTTRRHTGAVAL